jgi:hypothetical protein
MSLNLPLVAWGAAEAIASAPWTSINTPIVTAGQIDPFGGTDAVLVEDDNAGASEARVRSVGLLPTGRATVFPMFRAGTATASDFILLETATLTTKLQIRATWSGGVATVSIVTGGANATLHGGVALGAGWYGALTSIVGLNAAQAHEIRCYGAIPGGTAVGSTYWYLRNCVLLDTPSGPPTAWSQPRDESARTRGPDGGRISILKGRDYRFRGLIPGVPSYARSLPTPLSGWEGLNESIGVNCGVAKMLEAGQAGNPLLWVPDRSLCTSYISSELVAPWQGDVPTTRRNGDRGIALELRNTTTHYPLYA